MPAPGSDAANRDLRDQTQATLGDDYELEREMAGGMSRVFVAVQRSLGRRVVVKVLPPTLASGLSVERFRREILLAARLHHPHIVGVLTAGEIAEAGLPFYTMPFVEGESLRARLARDGALPVRTTVRILRGVAEALAHAHGHGVVHRDIKPENVLVVGDSALVTDFGVAKALAAATSDDGSQRREHAPSVTASGVLVGTPLYLAPEQAAGDPAVDHRADLYAFGLLAYELLAGTPPFAARTLHQLVAAHIAEEPEPLTARRPDVPPALAELVMRCLAKQPADRPQSAGEVVDALESVPASPSGADGAASRPADERRDAARPRWRRVAALAGGAAALAGGAAALGLALGSAVIVMRRPPEPALDPKRVLVAPFDNETGDPTLDPVGRMAADWLAQGLMQTGAVEVISSSSIAGAVAGRADPRDGHIRGLTAARELARQSRAGTVVWGAYYRQRDSVRLQAQIADANSSRLITSIEPVVVPAADPTSVADPLRERAMGALACLYGPAFTWGLERARPPTYAACVEWMEGIAQHTGRQNYRGALPHLLRAYELDSTFTLAVLYAASSYLNLGNFAAADSIVRLVKGSGRPLSPRERDFLEWTEANTRGDEATQLRVARRAAARDSEFVWVYSVGNHAVALNRPREAIDALARADEAGRRSGWLPYWAYYTAALHMLGDYARELEVARQARAVYPDRIRPLIHEARALAALGRVREALAVVDSATGRPPEDGTSPAAVMREAAAELRAHGHPAAARTAIDRALRWYRDQAPMGQQPQPGGGAPRAALASALYEAGRWDEARAVYESLAAGDSANVAYRAYLGLVAARRGDRTAAERAAAWLERLDRPYLFGTHTYYRARIAAVLGERERAVALLQQAFAQGRSYSVTLHREPDFEGLAGYPPFQELLRPKG